MAGKWGYINRYNTMVIENTMEYAYPFYNGYALTLNDEGTVRILKLQFYDYIK